MAPPNPEQLRLEAYRRREGNWKNWGPYLSEREWGTVREDYSEDGEAWRFVTHDQARSRAYRWNEDGLAGVCDRNQYLCFCLALWNGRDEMLKERLFGLTGVEGNHGEDVKELYYYLDSTPTHSYMKMLYKYPQGRYPYKGLVDQSYRQGVEKGEYEIIDTGLFDHDRYFDVFVEYAKYGQDDLFCKITAINRGDEAAPLHILPQLWFRNTWSWGYPAGPMGTVPGRPKLYQLAGSQGVQIDHPAAGRYFIYFSSASEVLFTENETNHERIDGQPNATPYVKDAFHRYVVKSEKGAINPGRVGTKCAGWFRTTVDSGREAVVWARICRQPQDDPFGKGETIFERRKSEADQFYASVQNPSLNEEELMIQRQAFAGLLWNKQLYYYDVEQWLHGDPAYPPPPRERFAGRNADWSHLTNFDIISMPDKWEYPWYATWDLGFHCLPMVLIDSEFAKRQLTLMTREWYMHPNGQLQAYEWEFGDANPPVHAWATWRVYKIDAKLRGEPDRPFLEGLFHKLMLNFTWWVNRKDRAGRNVFQGGFLGLDNISVFDRSKPLPTGGYIDQCDGTSWMAFYCIGMWRIAIELARENKVYEDTATKFFEHFLRIANAITDCGGVGHSLWDEEDGFFYDALNLPNGEVIPLKVRSLVGLLPLLAVETIEPRHLHSCNTFERRMQWFLQNRPHLAGNLVASTAPGLGDRHIMAILTKERLIRVLSYMLDENEFLSPHGIRSLSKVHEERPYILQLDGQKQTVPYWPAESRSYLFGGNSNWRGPVWFPLNFLIIEALQKYHHYYGPEFKVEFPTGSGVLLNLNEVAGEISRRLTSIFQRDEAGRRPVYGDIEKFQNDPHFKDLILFYEYFHGDTGVGLGASHQTGWTALVAKLIQQSGGDARLSSYLTLMGMDATCDVPRASL